MKKYAVFLVLLSFILFYKCGQNASDASEETQSQFTGQARIDAQKIVSVAQSALLAELQKGLEGGDPAKAVTYCNERAYPVTDSLSKHFGVMIRRVALKYRNPANKPDSIETAVLQHMAELSAKGQIPPAQTIDLFDGYIRHFEPIIMKPLCLNCHGVRERGDIAPATMDEIRKRYPDDRAYDFNLNELRGAWVVYMAANSAPDQKNK
ncbi:hypothetical protein JCM31826_06920 [Thermaurantimonas aggregans]|uniref:Tll0287-like domain-containing protein n=1 Tax=Thermaurantimonas aggregans TaxID=2173829 RepID=A0A401XJP1_9FLAO|nr:DUF3365 domain-containing protein [Thermaurantimonas aggregans]MCX8148633.1 DUF3365 domain-containing protein [Thermaurantimonas aggregans]GCD77210.1 hypothetical protein JCM31826_06920 [Thermaurantimonas aggregans]